MDYRVVLTQLAKSQLDHIVDYLITELESSQAAISVLENAEDTYEKIVH